MDANASNYHNTEFMKAYLAKLFIVGFVLIGVSWAQGRSKERYVVLRFLDQDVSVWVLDENDLSSFRTKCTGEVVADPTRHTLRVSGTGEVVYKTHRIAFLKSVLIDGNPLPAPGKNFLLLPNGEVREGFVRTFDREPHKK
jgi:hypothetical protein